MSTVHICIYVLHFLYRRLSLSFWALFDQVSKQSQPYYMGAASMHVQVSLSGTSFELILLSTVYSSQLENDVISLSLGHNGNQRAYETET